MAFVRRLFWVRGLGPEVDMEGVFVCLVAWIVLMM